MLQRATQSCETVSNEGKACAPIFRGAWRKGVTCFTISPCKSGERCDGRSSFFTPSANSLLGNSPTIFLRYFTGAYSLRVSIPASSNGSNASVHVDSRATATQTTQDECFKSATQSHITKCRCEKLNSDHLFQKPPFITPCMISREGTNSRLHG